MESLAGNLLIAVPDLQDVNFFRTVVFMFQHSEEGASGLILNRPSDVTIAKVWDEVAKEPTQCQDYVSVGGPVESPLLALHSSLTLAEVPVISGVFLSLGRENLNQLVNQELQKFRIFSGYSGWGPGQLESEIEQGGWLIHPATDRQVFDTPEGLWKQVCNEVAHDILKPHLGTVHSSDPSLN